MQQNETFVRFSPFLANLSEEKIPPQNPVTSLSPPFIQVDISSHNLTLFLFIYHFKPPFYLFIFCPSKSKVKQSLYTPWRRLGGEVI
jgi:hypothetical protein